MPLVDARKRQQNNINLAPTDPILAAHRSPGAPARPMPRVDARERQQNNINLAL